MTENNKPKAPVNDTIDNSELNTSDSHAIDTDIKHPDSEITVPSESKQKLILPSVALGLSMAALAVSAWLYVQSTQDIASKDIALLSMQQAKLNNQLEANRFDKTQLEQLLLQVKHQEERIQQQQAKFANQENTLAIQQAQQNNALLSLESRVNRLNTTSKEDWKLAEAEYLIRLANQRLLLESDNNAAISLLSSADDILKALEDPIVFTTRKALAKDIQALKSIAPFDLEGAYLRLNALYDNAPTLPQREPSKEWQAVTSAPTENIDTSAKVSAVLSSFWQSIRSLVVINYNQKPITALLPPAQYQQLITGLQLQLDVAQVALIKGEPIIYQQALDRVASATTTHFDTQSKLVTSFLSSLTALQQLNPTPDLPQPRDSLVAIKALMNDWNGRNILSTTTDETLPTLPTAPEKAGEREMAEEIEDQNTLKEQNSSDETPTYLGGDA